MPGADQVDNAGPFECPGSYELLPARLLPGDQQGGDRVGHHLGQRVVPGHGNQSRCPTDAPDPVAHGAHHLDVGTCVRLHLGMVLIAHLWSGDDDVAVAGRDR